MRKFLNSLVIPLVLIILCLSACLWKFGLSLQFIEFTIVLGLLIVLSIEDVKEYFISDRYIIAIAVAGLLFRIISLEFLQLLNGVISGTIIAMIIFALKKVFKQKIGNGDLKLLVAVSLSYGYAGMVNVLFFAVMIAAVYSIITLILKKKDKQSEIAFVPFITIGCILTILNL